MIIINFAIGKSTSYMSDDLILSCISDFKIEDMTTIKIFDSRLDYLKHIHFNPFKILFSGFAFLRAIGMLDSLSISIGNKAHSLADKQDILIFIYNIECFDSPNLDHKLDMIKLHIVSTIIHEIIHDQNENATEEEVLKLEQQYMENNFERICSILKVSKYIKVSDLEDCSICSE